MLRSVTILAASRFLALATAGRGRWIGSLTKEGRREQETQKGHPGWPEGGRIFNHEDTDFTERRKELVRSKAQLKIFFSVSLCLRGRKKSSYWSKLFNGRRGVRSV